MDFSCSERVVEIIKAGNTGSGFALLKESAALFTLALNHERLTSPIHHIVENSSMKRNRAFNGTRDQFGKGVNFGNNACGTLGLSRTGSFFVMVRPDRRGGFLGVNNLR
jgi:hypothetical protein